MKNPMIVLYISLLFIAILSGFHPANCETEAIEVSVNADATVKSSDPSNNYGDSATLTMSWYVVGGGNSYNYAYLKYDLDGYYTGCPKAELVLCIDSFPDAKGSTLYLYYSSDDSWTENDITWNNKPSYNSTPLGSKYFDGSTPMSIAPVDEIVSVQNMISTVPGNFVVDVTNLVKNEADKKLTFVLKLSGSDGTVYTYSKDDPEGRGYNINKLVLYSDGVPAGRIDEKFIRQNYTSTRVQLYHSVDESNPDVDYYAIYGTLQNIWRIEQGNNYYRPKQVQIVLEMDDCYEEINHEPRIGDYGSSPFAFSVGGSFYGISLGFSIRPPCYHVNYHREEADGKLKVTWTAQTWKYRRLGSSFVIAVDSGNLLFEDTINYFFEFTVPEGYKPTVAANSMTTFYYDDTFFTTKHLTEDSGWLYVDPPNSPPITVDPVTVSPPQIIYPAPRFDYEDLDEPMQMIVGSSIIIEVQRVLVSCNICDLQGNIVFRLWQRPIRMVVGYQ